MMAAMKWMMPKVLEVLGVLKVLAVLTILMVLVPATPLRAQRAVLSTRPETPFKLATFEAAGKVRVGLVLGTRILDIEAANAVVVQAIDLRGGPAMPFPSSLASSGSSRLT